MAAFHAELEVDGQTYVVVLCDYSFTQSTGARGRVNEKVRHGLLELVLDVPDGDQLLAWAAAPRRPLDGHVSFFSASEFMAHETVSFKDGECVSYEESFTAGAGNIGAYRCRLTIAAAQLDLTAGGPGRVFTAPDPREHGQPTTLAGAISSAKRAYATVQTARAQVAQVAQTAAGVQEAVHAAGQTAGGALAGAQEVLTASATAAALGQATEAAKEVVTKKFR
ncbi:MAG: type VI secretion system tube protein TssD [Janthinobacterium lividum]